MWAHNEALLADNEARILKRFVEVPHISMGPVFFFSCIQIRQLLPKEHEK
jgi:hypothetical protein